MKAVICSIPDHLLEERRRRGADRWDEVWDGVLHMPPAPNREHQDLQGLLYVWLILHWARPNRAKVYENINLAAPGGWPDREYRIPDLLLLVSDRYHIDRNEYFEGAPNVVVEIHSPGDESYEKLPFYAELGVPEVWIIDRDTRVPELYVLAANEYHAAAPNTVGWLVSLVTGVEMKAGANDKLLIRMAKDPTTQEAIPED